MKINKGFMLLILPINELYAKQAKGPYQIVWSG